VERNVYRKKEINTTRRIKRIPRSETRRCKKNISRGHREKAKGRSANREKGGTFQNNERGKNLEGEHTGGRYKETVMGKKDILC